MDKVTSAALFLTDGEVFLAVHPTGPRKNLDIPKGIVNINESPREACVREVIEETGLELKLENLIDIGLTPYLRNKDLHIFLSVVDKGALPPIEKYKCTSTFEGTDGKTYPEVDGFQYIKLDEASNYLSENMMKALNSKSIFKLSKNAEATGS